MVYIKNKKGEKINKLQVCISHKETDSLSLIQCMAFRKIAHDKKLNYSENLLSWDKTEETYKKLDFKKSLNENKKDKLITIAQKKTKKGTAKWFVLGSLVNSDPKLQQQPSEKQNDNPALNSFQKISQLLLLLPKNSTIQPTSAEQMKVKSHKTKAYSKNLVLKLSLRFINSLSNEWKLVNFYYPIENLRSCKERDRRLNSIQIVKDDFFSKMKIQAYELYSSTSYKPDLIELKVFNNELKNQLNALDLQASRKNQTITITSKTPIYIKPPTINYNKEKRLKDLKKQQEKSGSDKPILEENLEFLELLSFNKYINRESSPKSSIK